jgi:hypothetical protein
MGHMCVKGVCVGAGRGRGVTLPFMLPVYFAGLLSLLHCELDSFVWVCSFLVILFSS